MTFKEQKEFSELEERIAVLENSLKEYEKDMSNTDYEKSKAAGDKYTAAQTELETAYARWEELASLA